MESGEPKSLNWRDYEIYIKAHFQRLFPEAKIEHDVRRSGLMSKIERQIDILIEGSIAGFHLTVIVDCKYFGKKVDVKDVDEFLGYLQDLRASKGILITNNGYTAAAHNRAMNDTRDIELRIIDFKDLEQFQSFIAIPYFGSHGAIVSVPEGWIADVRSMEGVLASFYPMGIKRDQAFHREGIIYFSYSKKSADWPTLDHLLDSQAKAMRARYRNPRFDVRRIQIRDDSHCYARDLECEEMPATVETTVFLDYAEVIIFMTLLAPRAKHADYCRKLMWMGEKLIKIGVIYDVAGRPLSSWKEESE